jgi:hypothetical protein
VDGSDCVLVRLTQVSEASNMYPELRSSNDLSR